MNKKSILLVDNHAVVAIMAKGRSSSTQIQGTPTAHSWLARWQPPLLGARQSGTPPMGLPVGLADARFKTRDAKGVRVAEAHHARAESPKKCPRIFEDFCCFFEIGTTLP